MTVKYIRVVALMIFCAIWSMTATGAELIARWSFDQDAGKEVTDDIGEHHGSIKGGNAAWVPGKFGNGLEIKGPNQYVEVEKSADLELNALTLIAWVNLKAPGARQEVASYADSYGIFVEGVFKALLFKGGGWDVVTGVTPVKADTWYQVAQTVDKNGMNIYVNGKLDAKLATPPVAYQNFAMWFGGGPADNQFWLTGILDEIELWDDVLSEAEISALFDAPPSLAVEPTSDKLATTWGILKSQ